MSASAKQDLRYYKQCFDKRLIVNTLAVTMVTAGVVKSIKMEILT